MITNLSANRELEDYNEEDAFNFKIKADAIKAFLEFNVESIKCNKMLALYGDWGSGKTSLMRYLERTIDRRVFFPIFFHAWEFEKDENLALSLCDVMTANLEDVKNPVINSFKENAVHLLKGFSAGTTIKFGNKFLGIDIEVDGSKVSQSFEKSILNENSSHFKQKQAFKSTFNLIENLILKKADATRIIVFVDDLDRCEPENVLNLITALKLFFTYGENTIFMAGLDKDAVNKAVMSKYRDVVKSEEYLEKVFDITFNVPKIFSLENFLATYFVDKSVSKDERELPHTRIIDHFFRSIHFTNPRKIKKILNKYEILVSFKKATKDPQIERLIPDILDRSGNGNIFETIYCLLFIILYEYFPNEFNEIEHYNRKFDTHLQVYLKSVNLSTGKFNTGIAAEFTSFFYIRDIETKTIDQLMHDDEHKRNDLPFDQFLLIFSNKNPSNLGVSLSKDYGNYFLDDGILTLFCKFLIKYKQSIETNKFSDYVFWNYFLMAKYLL